MKHIKLHGGLFSIVDDEDENLLNKYIWHKGGKNGYVIGYLRGAYNNRKCEWVSMHRLILGLTKGDGIHVDHINFNKLDNRKNNLRKCSRFQNNKHRQSRPNSSSKYLGVHKLIIKQKYKYYMASVTYQGIRINLGTFKNEMRAAWAYDEFAHTHYGEFANLNFK